MMPLLLAKLSGQVLASTLLADFALGNVGTGDVTNPHWLFLPAASSSSPISGMLQLPGSHAFLNQHIPVLFNNSFTTDVYIEGCKNNM
jgi:hypothetical protein